MTTRTRRSHAEITTLVLQLLQDTGAATYEAAVTNYAIEESLKEFATYDPHIIPMVFKIESRTGTDTAGDTDVLTDTTKSQFITTTSGANAMLLGEDEKVVHNTTDNTWAVTSTATVATTSVMTLNADIMASSDNYEIYNKRCWNNKQIWIGDRVERTSDVDGISHVSVPSYLWVDSVEYPIGTKRNFKIYGDVLEIDVDSVADSDLTATTLPDIDVLVRFAMPHKLCQSTDLEGAVNSEGDAGTIAIVADGFTSGQICRVGDEFHIEHHRSTYTCAEQVTWATEGVVLYFYPPLEAIAVADDYVNFTRSTLKPQHEELFCHLVAARCLISEANAQLIQAKADMTSGRALINTVNKGGAGTSVATAYIAYARAEEEMAREQRSMGERKLAEVIGKMERLSPPRTKRSYPTD